jgi:Flp pilus assembly protein TadG
MVEGAVSNASGNPVRGGFHSCWLAALARSLRKGDGGAQMVEFAVSLPLLVVFVVGIFDFSGAFTLKQKLANAAREGARAAASGPATDLTNAIPASVSDAFQVMDNYLIDNKINDCGISATPTGAFPTWTYAATGNGCPGAGLTLTINRGCVTTQNTAQGTVNLVNTCVTITYAYQWRFNRVIGLLGGTSAVPSKLTTIAVAFNEN